MARRSSLASSLAARPARVFWVWLALAGCTPPPAAAAADQGDGAWMQVGIAAELRPDGGKPPLLTTVPEPEPGPPK